MSGTHRGSWFGRRSRATAGLAVLLAVLGAWSGDCSAEDAPTPAGRFVKHVHRDADGPHHFQVFVPAGEAPKQGWPLILYLHGALECGDDGVKPVQIGLGPYVRARAATFRFVVVFPQCETTEGRRYLERWLAGSPDSRRALAVLAQVERDYPIDTKHEIVTGWSMGGYGAWSFGIADPDRWAAVVPVSGGGLDPAAAAKLKGVPVWAIHGAKDQIVRPERSREMIDALRAAGGKARHDEPADWAHVAWKLAYDSEAMFAWMLDPKAGGPPATVELVAKGTPLPLDTTPFVPAVEISHAAYLRLGNEVFDVLSKSIPEQVSSELLAGALDPITVAMEAIGNTYECQFSNVTYRFELTSADIRPTAGGQLRARLGLENITITIGDLMIEKVDVKKRKGKPPVIKRKLRAQVLAPVEIRIGHANPVILEISVTPHVRDRHVHFELAEARLVIPRAEFQVFGLSKKKIKVKGLGVTKGVVYDELSKGLVESRTTIEEKVESLVPVLLKEMEKYFELAQTGSLVDSFWPLPVYQPRMRVWPEAVSVDRDGMSIALGLTAAAHDAFLAPKRPVQVALGKGLLAAIPRTRQLQFGFNTQLIEPLMQMLIDNDVARIDVRDIPEPAFAVLGDRKRLTAAIPDLARLTGHDVRAELVLDQSIQLVEPAGPRQPGRVMLSLEIPGARVAVSVRPAGDEGAWKPYVDFSVSVRQQARVRLVPAGKGERSVKLEWAGKPEINVSGRFAAGAAPENKLLKPEPMREMFASAWQAWTASGPLASLAVADFEFGEGVERMGLVSVGWDGPLFYATFALSEAAGPPAADTKPGVTIVNRSGQTVEFEIRRPGQAWSGPYRLGDRQTRTFASPKSLTYRRRTDDGVKLFTLEPGSRFEFRVLRGSPRPRLFQVRPPRR